MSSLSLAGAGVRDAGASDLPAVRRVLLAAYQEYAATLPPAVFGRYRNDILDAEGRAGVGEVLVAERGGRVVGTVTYYPDASLEGFGWPAGWAGLRALGVDPGARGLGVGRGLLAACLERAEAAGAPVLCLHTAEFMTAAVAIYEQAGFRATRPTTSTPPAGSPSAGCGRSRSSPTGSTSPGGSRRPGSARWSRTRSAGSAGSCGSRRPRPTATCWSPTCTCAPAGGWPASTSIRSPVRRSRWFGASWRCAAAGGI